MSLGHGIPKETQQTGAERKTETEGESKARKLEASKKKDFVYSQHWRHLRWVDVQERERDAN